MWHELLTTTTLLYLWYTRKQQQKFRFKTVLFGSDLAQEGMCLKQFLPKDITDKVYIVNVYTDNPKENATTSSHLNTNGHFLVNCSFDSVSVKEMGFDPFNRNCRLNSQLVFSYQSGEKIDDLELFYLTISEI